MKQLFIFCALFLPLMAFSQTQGEVLYLESVKLNIDLPEGDEAMAKMLPASQSWSRSLFFNEKAAVYKDADLTDSEDMEFNAESDNGGEIKMVLKRPENTYYTSLEDGKIINSREFFGRMFLINGDVKKYALKLTGEQKNILGYQCQKAAFKDDERSVEVWFTPQIPVSIGPGEYAGLPGLILEVSIDNGERTTIAQKIELKEIPNDAIEKPTKGKEVTQEEFDKIEAEKMKEMDMETGGSGKGMKIIIKQD